MMAYITSCLGRAANFRVKVGEEHYVAMPDNTIEIVKVIDREKAQYGPSKYDYVCTSKAMQETGKELVVSRDRILRPLYAWDGGRYKEQYKLDPPELPERLKV